LDLAQISQELRTSEARFALLRELAGAFSRRPRRSWGYPPDEIEVGRRLLPLVTAGASGASLPEALAQWYVTVGRVPELTSCQNRLLGPADLELKDGVVTIYAENQGCAFWGIRTEALGQDDPPIVVGDTGVWRCESDALSKFALTVGLSELCLSGGTFGCSGCLDPAASAALRAALAAAQVHPLQWPAERDACFLVDAETVVLLEAEFLFAAGRQQDVDEHLARLAVPGRIEWQRRPRC
jgi:hypothetical protein